ncbi:MULTISPECIES: phosphatase PAP2 family protein [Streptomyces]|uniref:Phosphatidic acid phosphatase type 2/haloperoxidase domain-containing protein n=1 Tax=Streptomyces venezuelae TaxID=54571 RepID=A0A5P2B790_STRVZ|nr:MULTISPECIES: phosphatase PAP2 family protein [Streptomyces]NEA02818.1 phosphatase PAP2 family protein [Streptomyces sp. SID10116]MYY84537.1 phosphatase PAP2 family protein [Streptomyces sp. SID335]MYZ12976.1 phosphatase PAP2 family protein [Streptomyces sp. SID337]NDZ87221.1 phosphatase PAP2 family protein [Streptomyces sp. SID10115]NEB45619.1 phosphatase PAP2 family protein [Streptomyces sp. SID339]
MYSAPIDTPTRPPGVRAALTAAALGVPSLLLLLLVALEWRPLLSLDGDISRTTHRWAVDESGVTRVSRVLTDWVWDPWTMRALCAVVVIWLALRGALWLALWLTGTCAVGSAVQQGLKAAVDRPRPVWPDPVDSAHYAAFPSGHAMTAVLVSGLLLWVLHLYGARPAVWRACLTLAVISVVGVGATRVWLGVHWPTDVVGGWLLGALMVALAIMTYAYGPAKRTPEAT